MLQQKTVPCETCSTPTPYEGTKRCNNCWEVERRLPDYLRSPKGQDFVRKLLPLLDDWADGHPDAWDHEAVLRDNRVTVEWSRELIDGENQIHPAGEWAGWGFYWKHGAIHIGQCVEKVARKAAALFVSLWLRGVSASFCDKIMSGMIWYWELQERPERANVPNQLGLAKLFHETYERLAPDYGYTTRPETSKFDDGSPNGRLMVAVCGEVLRKLGLGEEQEGKIDNMPDSPQDSDTAQLLRGRAKACEAVAGELEIAADEIAGLVPEDNDEEEPGDTEGDPSAESISQVENIISGIGWNFEP